MLKIKKANERSKMVILEGECPKCGNEHSSIITEYYHHKTDYKNSILRIKCFVCGKLHKMKFRELLNGDEEI